MNRPRSRQNPDRLAGLWIDALTKQPGEWLAAKLALHLCFRSGWFDNFHAKRRARGVQRKMLRSDAVNRRASCWCGRLGFERQGHAVLGLESVACNNSGYEIHCRRTDEARDKHIGWAVI